MIGISIPSTDEAARLFKAIKDGNIGEVEAALEAGADLNGHPNHQYAPIATATNGSHMGIVKLLLEKGADPDKPVTLNRAAGGPMLGVRCLHIAAIKENVEILRLLLQRPRADPNVTDNEGRTPLMMTCSFPFVSVEVVRLLLEAGADPFLSQNNGMTPLHMVALNGNNMALVDMLYTNAPQTVNRCTPNGISPLFVACVEGNESMASKLLSLEATELKTFDVDKPCLLTETVEKGFEGVVRVLMNEGGIPAVGGMPAMLRAFVAAIRCRRPVILRLLLTAKGYIERSELENSELGCINLLHFGVGFCYPAAVSILLEAGCYEAEHHSKELVFQDSIGIFFNSTDRTDWGEAVAIRRMLHRGPAYRARSWAWPSDDKSDTCGNGDGVSTGATAAAAVHLPPLAVNLRLKSGAHIFRPMGDKSSKRFISLICR